MVLQTAWLRNNRNLLSHSLGAKKSKLTVLAQLYALSDPQGYLNSPVTIKEIEFII